MHPLKRKCTNECRKLTSEEVALVLRTKSLFQMSIHHWTGGLTHVNIVNTWSMNELPPILSSIAPL